MDLQAVLNLADQKRNAQQWREAVALYRQLESQLTGNAAFHHNLALCLLGANQPGDALVQAELALARQAGLWQSAVVKVRALAALGRPQEAAALLEALRQRHPERAEFTLELATITLHEECDARRARALVRPWLNVPAAATDARLTDLMASLYDHDESVEAVNECAVQFARAHLDRGAAGMLAAGPVPARTRPRIGLLSPHFNSSPVFFFCSGALSLLAAEFDLVFFNRGRRADWATQQLRALAAEWFEAADLGAEPLEALIRRQALDALVDLGGWMDPIGLQALSTKPAARLYKWVGGQSITTGLRAFDGFITDAAQTPAGYERWFTEPLLRLPLGYVSYTPPPYLPAPVPAPADAHVLGVIANPVKVSQPFLTELGDSLPARVASGLPLTLRFIDKRYAHPRLQQRIRSALLPAQQALGERLSVEFIVPDSHLAYLTAVGQLSEMVDTFPYTGGLTTMEALSLGVPCSGKAGTLFCERHTHAHLHYLQAPGARRRRMAAVKPGAARTSLVPPDSPRANHAALAAALAQLLRHGTLAQRAA